MKKNISKNLDVSILLPCLNEEQSIDYCLNEIRQTIGKMREADGTVCEVIVIDNGSTDHSVERVRLAMATFPELILASEPVRGYGSAYMCGLSTACGNYIFLSDIDGSYDFKDIPKFVLKLKEGYGLVIGNRFSDENENGTNGAAMEKQAMPWLHRHIGNPFLSYVTRLLFKVKVKDIHCGMRALTRSAAREVNPHAAGMEFASEMIIKAARRNVATTEIAIPYRKRIGESKLRSFPRWLETSSLSADLFSRCSFSYSWKRSLRGRNDHDDYYLLY